jgi:hypothetical protein
LQEFSIELGLELIERLGNLRLNHLKRIHNPEIVSQNYAEGRLVTHAQRNYWGTVGHDVPGVWVANGDGRGSIMNKANEFIVFVDIADTCEIFRPGATLIRLQPLDCCDMHAVNSGKECLAPLLEYL